MKESTDLEAGSTHEPTDDPRIDDVRRKLLRSTALLGGAFAAGHLPYSSPAVKSFFGNRSAWAQGTPPPPPVINPIVQIIQPVNLPFVIITGGAPPLVVGNNATVGESKTGTFSVKNVGNATVVFNPPSITGAGAPSFSIEGATVDAAPAMAPFNLDPNKTAIVTVKFTCPQEEVPTLHQATVVLDIKTTTGGAVQGVENVPLSGKCGTLDCALNCSNPESSYCTPDTGGSLSVLLRLKGNESESFEVVNTGSLSFNVTAVEVSPAHPNVTLTPMTGIIAPGAKLEQMLELGGCFAETNGTTTSPTTVVVTAQSVDLVDGAPVPVMCPPVNLDAACSFQ